MNIVYQLELKLSIQ